MSKIRCETLVDLVQICDFDEEDNGIYEYLQTEEGMKVAHKKTKEMFLEELTDIFGDIDDLDVECYFTLINDEEVTNA